MRRPDVIPCLPRAASSTTCRGLVRVISNFSTRSLSVGIRVSGRFLPEAIRRRRISIICRREGIRAIVHRACSAGTCTGPGRGGRRPVLPSTAWLSCPLSGAALPSSPLWVSRGLDLGRKSVLSRRLSRAAGASAVTGRRERGERLGRQRDRLRPGAVRQLHDEVVDAGVEEGPGHAGDVGRLPDEGSCFGDGLGEAK